MDTPFTRLRGMYLELVRECELDQLDELELMDEFAEWANDRIAQIEEEVSLG